MTRRRLGPGDRFDRDGTLYVLRDNIARADAMITAAEHLIEEYPWGTRDEEGGQDDEDEDETATASAAAGTTWRT